ncbi:hypothetical protein JCM8208_000350 [Rhodotorula glutinis]
MQHLQIPDAPTPPTAEPLPPLPSTSSLLALPDELLDLVVDQALGELVAIGAPSTTRALSVFGGKAGPQMCEPRCVHTFTALRRLVLVGLKAFDLDKVSQMAELRELVLSSVSLTARQPVVALKLKSFGLNFGSQSYIGKLAKPGAKLLVAQDVPALEHIFFAGTQKAANAFCDADLVARTQVFGSDLLDFGVDDVRWAGRLRADRDKVLFDLPSSFIPLLEELGESDTQHLRICSLGDWITPPPHGIDKEYQELADQFPIVFPRLKSLYIAAGLDASRVMLPRDLVDAMSALTSMCRHKGVELVFEGSIDEYVVGESRRSAHFEARCRRIEAERAASTSRA